MAEMQPLPPVAETEEQKKKRLAEEARTGRIRGYMPAVDKGALPTSQAYVDKMQELASDSAYTPKDTTPEDRKSLQNILDLAQKQFEDAQSRAEWQDVAQTLGKALVQYGAASTGGGRDQSNIAQPTVDYGARINAAQQTLAGRQKTALSKFELDKQAKDEELKQQANEYRNIADALEAGRKTASAREQDQASLDRAIKLERQRAANDAAKEKNVKPDYTPIKLQLDDLSSQEKQLTGEVKAAQQLFNDQATVEDLSKKPAADLKKKYGQLAANAGIDLNDLSAKLEATDKPGTFWNTPDPGARKKILDSELAPKLNLLRDIRKQKQDILASISGGQPAQAPAAQTAPAPQQSSASGPTEEQVKQYASQYKLPEDKARAILIKRMSGGK